TVLEAVRVFTGVNSITAGSGTGATLGYTTVANDVNSFMANKDTIVASLGKSGDSSFHLRAGTEIQSNASLTVGTATSDWNLYSTTRAGGEPGVLTLRAKDNITFNGSLSDGFTNTTLTGATAGTVGEGESWAYRIVAGADFDAANVLTTESAGNITLGNDKAIRTGTGDIEIAAGGNLTMGNAGSVIYTAGRQADVLAGFDLPAAGIKPLYLTDGGDVSINVQGNIVGREPATGRQLINQWLFRQGGGSGNLDTTWWVRPDLFRQSLATFGGGDINIAANGSISNFSASAATTARFDSNGSTGNQVINGGGDLTIGAGGDINNGVYFVAKGDGNINAGGNIQKQGNTFGTVLALQDGSFNVNADKDVYIENVINPTQIAQSTTNAPQINTTGINSYFNTYADSAKASVGSLLGDIGFGRASQRNLSQVSGLDLGVVDSLNYYPATVTAVAHSGDVSIGSDAGEVVLLPSASGNLKLLAANNINISNISMSGADASLLASVQNPLRNSDFRNTSALLKIPATQLLHKNNADSVMIVANNGNVSAVINSQITLPKQAKIVAGQDIINVKLDAQNNNASDITLIKAGNDVKVDDITLAGPGNLLVQAGRNIDLS
ncbi:MAG: filamentous hemagglutinin, partial [Pseudomonadota bacterium]